MIERLEGTTIELIHKRQIRSGGPGTGMIILVLGLVVVLPLLKVDIVSSSPGMIRPVHEPAMICSSLTGIVDSSVIRDHLEIAAGDTLVWISRDIPETRIREYRALISSNRDPIRDIKAILQGRIPFATSRFIQSFRSHLAAGHHLDLQRDYLEQELRLSEKLYRQEVIPRSEFEKIRSEYLISCAMVEKHREGYLSILEDELYRLEEENRHYLGEINNIHASLRQYCVIAPATGILSQCPGISGGSSIQQGERLGIINPSGSVVAECYLQTRDIFAIKVGTPVRLRFDNRPRRAGSVLESRITQIDPDAVVTDGSSAYRVRCLIEHPFLDNGKGETVPVISGMTFIASMVIDRRSLGSIALERINLWGNPGIRDHSRHHVP
jgi:multidrug resistance efflux pump